MRFGESLPGGHWTIFYIFEWRTSSKCVVLPCRNCAARLRSICCLVLKAQPWSRRQATSLPDETHVTTPVKWFSSPVTSGALRPTVKTG